MDERVVWGIPGPRFASSLLRMVQVPFAKCSPKWTSKNVEILNAAIAHPQMQTVYVMLEIIFGSGQFFASKILFSLKYWYSFVFIKILILKSMLLHLEIFTQILLRVLGMSAHILLVILFRQRKWRAGEKYCFYFSSKHLLCFSTLPMKRGK